MSTEVALIEGPVWDIVKVGLSAIVITDHRPPMETRRKMVWYPCRRLQREYLQQLPAATSPRMITSDAATETFQVAREV